VPEARNFVWPMQPLRGGGLLTLSLPSAIVLRTVLRPYLALLLLLCLVRTLLPEAWVLALHAHSHTTEAAPTPRSTGKELLSPRHTHCHVEQFYQVPFRLALPVALPQPRLRARYQLLAVPVQFARSATALRSLALRGPPQAYILIDVFYSFLDGLSPGYQALG
jgi:hypothetical protein